MRIRSRVICSGLVLVALFFLAPLVRADNTQATNEVSFMSAIYHRYIGNVTNYTTAFQPLYDLAKTRITTDGFSVYYRELCTQVTLSALVRGAALTTQDKAIQRLINTYNRTEFRSVLASDFKWLAGAHAFDCLIAANVARNVIPRSTLDPLLEDFAHYWRLMLNGDATFPAQTPQYFQSNWLNKGNTPAEEANAVATFLLAASKLLPDTGPGAITAIERSALYARARDLLLFTYTHCDRGCGFQNNSWQVINHQLDPNPNYSLSHLTAYSEAAMLYRQLNENYPTDLFTSSISNSIAQTALALQPYLSPTYGFTGPFSIVSSDRVTFPNTTFDYGQMKYTMRNQDSTYPINSSIPTDRVDSMNQWILTGTSQLKSYVFRDGKVWHYICNLGVTPVDCWAEYQTTPLSAFWQTIQRQNEVSPGWGGITPPNKVEAMTQWYEPFTSRLRTYMWNGDRYWMYICENGFCTAQFTALVAGSLPIPTTQTSPQETANWNTYPPPASFDAITQYVIPGTRTLRGFFLKGNRVWATICDNFGTPQNACYAFYTKDLTSFWQPIGGDWNAAGWITNPPPADNVDSFHQYYHPSGALKSYIIKGNRTWAYECANGSCYPQYTNNLSQFWGSIRETYKWPFEISQGSGQIVGVTDWGMDATFQNSAFTTIAAFAPQYTSMYSNLQAEQLRRGKQQEPPVPPVYSGTSWVWANFTGYQPNRPAVSYMTDGWQGRDANTASPLSSTQWWPPILGDAVNFHAWLNMLAAKNHSVAYLMMTDNRGLLQKFAPPNPSPTSTPVPSGPTYSISDLKNALSGFLSSDAQWWNNDGKTNMLDAAFVIKWVQL